jgi:hypothetical protein
MIPRRTNIEAELHLTKPEPQFMMSILQRKGPLDFTKVGTAKAFHLTIAAWLVPIFVSAVACWNLVS